MGRDSYDILKLLSCDDRLRTCFDTNHLFYEDIGEYIHKVGSKLVTTHVSDFDYKNENVEYLTIDNMPYYDKDVLKLQCSLYEVSDDDHENKELVFISKDNGFNWKVEDN